MTYRKTHINYWLYPIACLYGLGVWIRNKLFDWGWLRSESFNVPIIGVGNLAVGGTGKTPHTEYLIKLLQNVGLNVATLSRGYKRKSKGYILASADSTANDIGDEPCQMKQKFPDIQVAVDVDRRHGIKELLKIKQPQINVILLDDAYQHRYVKAGLNILLTDYNRLMCDDALLPAGRLREPVQEKERAQIVIVTKCPEEIKPIDFNIVSKRLNLYPYQQLYFTQVQYGALTPLFPNQANKDKITQLDNNLHVLLVAGIANPAPLVKKLQAYTKHIKTMLFDDHHDFNTRDIHHINEEFDKLNSQNRIIITTEKDGSRLKHHKALTEQLKPFIYLLPIEIEILRNQQAIFNQNIVNYVRTYPRNCELPKK